MNGLRNNHDSCREYHWKREEDRKMIERRGTEIWSLEFNGGAAGADSRLSLDYLQFFLSSALVPSKKEIVENVDSIWPIFFWLPLEFFGSDLFTSSITEKEHVLQFGAEAISHYSRRVSNRLERLSIYLTESLQYTFPIEKCLFFSLLESAVSLKFSFIHYLIPTLWNSLHAQSWMLPAASL